MWTAGGGRDPYAGGRRRVALRGPRQGRLWAGPGRRGPRARAPGPVDHRAVGPEPDRRRRARAALAADLNRGDVVPHRHGDGEAVVVDGTAGRDRLRREVELHPGHIVGDDEHVMRLGRATGERTARSPPREITAGLEVRRR